MVTCPICNRDFKNNSSLRSHRSRFHGSSKVEENINQTYKDTPVPDNSDLDSANEPTDISDIESDTSKERDDGSEEASDNEEDESDINVDDTENNTETSEYENSDGRVSPVKRKVYRKRKRDALSTPIDSSEDEYPKKRVRRSHSVVDRRRAKLDLFNTSSSVNKIAKIHSLLKDNFNKSPVDYAIIVTFLDYVLPKIQQGLLCNGNEDLVEKFGKEAGYFIWFSGLSTEQLTRYKVLHDIAKAEKFGKSICQMVDHYVDKFESKL
jgi:hypothetical protein